jgi:hypothetical protein
MHDKTPWTGGISNKQILVDSVRSLAIWLAVTVPLFALLWWLSGAFSVFAPLRPFVGAIAAVGAFMVSWLTKSRRRNA